jgi:hypothetical protein
VLVFLSLTTQTEEVRNRVCLFEERLMLIKYRMRGRDFFSAPSERELASKSQHRREIARVDIGETFH